MPDSKLRIELGLGHTDNSPAHLLNLLNQPSLEIRGMSAAQTGTRAANIIPSTATADLDLRLVIGVDWRKQQQRVISYIRSQKYFIVDKPPTREETRPKQRHGFIEWGGVSCNSSRWMDGTAAFLPRQQKCMSR